jgi:hypothetical protein
MNFTHNRNGIMISAVVVGLAIAFLVFALASWPTNASIQVSDNNDSNGSSDGMGSTLPQPITPSDSSVVQLAESNAPLHKVMLDCSNIPQQAYQSSILPLSVRISDSAYDNRPVSGETVSWVIMPMGHLMPSTTTSDANGLVQDSLSLSGFPVGIYKIQAHFVGSSKYLDSASCEAQVFVLGQSTTTAPAVKSEIEDIDANVGSSTPANTTTTDNTNSTNNDNSPIHQPHGGGGSNNNCVDTNLPSVTIGGVTQEPITEGESSTIAGVRLDMAGTASDSATSCEKGLKEVKTAILNFDTNEVVQWYGTTSDNSQGWNSQSIVHEDGQYRVVARAIDEAGKTKWTSEVTDVNYGLESIQSHISIDSPTYGIKITGPSSAALAEVSGMTSYVTDKITKVEVRVDENPYQLATPVAEGDWHSWSTNLTIDTEGTHSIIARSTDEKGHTLWAFINVEVEFDDEA